MNTFTFQVRCSDCKYWSELIAQSTIGGPVEAVCLAVNISTGEEKGPYAGQFTTGEQYCEFFSAGAPIDSV